MNDKAVVLLSGGLDSSTVLALAKDQGFEPYALSFRYGQRHEIELAAAARVAEAQGVKRHVVCDIDLRKFGGSALTSDLEVPKFETDSGAVPGEIPITYVPARNTVFLSYALAYAEVIGSSDIFIGVSSVDYSGYPDCRPEFIEAFERMANLATKAGVEGKSLRIHAPLMQMSKGQTVREGVQLGVNYALTSSCYDPDVDGHPCGHCESCLLRIKGFREAGLADPLVYQGDAR